MKKVMLILMLGVFTFSTSSFTTFLVEENCDDTAEVAYDVTLHSGGSQGEANNAYFHAYWRCIDDGGDSEFTVEVD